MLDEDKAGLVAALVSDLKDPFELGKSLREIDENFPFLERRPVPIQIETTKRITTEVRRKTIKAREVTRVIDGRAVKQVENYPVDSPIYDVVPLMENGKQIGEQKVARLQEIEVPETRLDVKRDEDGNPIMAWFADPVQVTAWCMSVFARPQLFSGEQVLTSLEAAKEKIDDRSQTEFEADEDYDVSDLLRPSETRESGLARWIVKRERLVTLRNKNPSPQVSSQIAEADHAIRRLTRGRVEIVG